MLDLPFGSSLQIFGLSSVWMGLAVGADVREIDWHISSLDWDSGKLSGIALQTMNVFTWFYERSDIVFVELLSRTVIERL